MNSAIVDGVVKAVLYEGYLLYPYRPSSVKNRQRFNFGVVYPRLYSESQGGTEAWTMQTQCLVRGDEDTRCMVRVRFLRMVERSVGKPRVPNAPGVALVPGDVEKVEQLEVNGRTYRGWQEALEEAIEVEQFGPSDLVDRPMQWPFRLSARQEVESVRDEQGSIVGAIVREKAGIFGVIDLSAERLEPGLFKLTVHIANDGPMLVVPLCREDALLRALVSTHTILEVHRGEFISLVDPPETCRDFARACQNVGTWPVLVGDDCTRDTLLSSPIILYDYPQVAPESPGDLFDGAEIDEILSLRIMTLTDTEKAEMRQSDERARKILERTDSLPEEQLRKLHGAMRQLRH